MTGSVAVSKDGLPISICDSRYQRLFRFDEIKDGRVHSTRGLAAAGDRFQWRWDGVNPLFQTEQLAARSIEEMQPAAGLAVHGFVGAERIIRRGFVRKPVLHIHAGPWTLKTRLPMQPVSLTTAYDPAS